PSPKGTILPPTWHLAYFPSRVPESKLASDGYEQDWSPPFPHLHRMWASGELSWNQRQPIKSRSRGYNAIFSSRHSNESKEENAAIPFLFGSINICIIIRVDNADHPKETASTILPPSPSSPPSSPLPPPTTSPDFIINLKPTPVTLFRFSALTFNSYLIHYDHIHSTTKEINVHNTYIMTGRLTHGPLSFTKMVNYLDKHLLALGANSGDSPRKKITNLSYPCFSPLVVNDPITVMGRQSGANERSLWVLDHEGNVAVKGSVVVEGERIRERADSMAD
ncbi:hypothetical protein BD408DRAFT_341918, partial [Parasitella parasitica]